MSSTNHPTQNRHAGRYALRVNAYDRTAGWLMAMLACAVVVFGLLVVVFVFRIEANTERFVGDVTLAPNPNDGALPLPPSLDPPGDETAVDDAPPELAAALTALDSEAAKKAAMLESPSVGEGTTSTVGKPVGDDHRDRGPLGEPDCPKEMRYEPVSLADYKQMLDFFKVELGVIAPDGKIYFASNLSSPEPVTRIDTREGENDRKRFYFISNSNPLKEMELAIARETGIMKQGGLVVAFYPDKTKGQIYKLEQIMMNDNNVDDRSQVQKTVYRFFRVGPAYDFKIESQTYY